MGDFLAALNERQRMAVMVEGGALVLAGAGTGKTRVLTGRIARLILQSGESDAAILAVTFTNKAAREMRGRVEHLLSWPVRGLALGTFHGICHRILRRHFAAAGLAKNFQILDSQDQLSFIRRLLRERNIDAKQFSPNEVRGYISSQKESGYRAAAAAERASHDRARRMAQIYAFYEVASREESKADFGELLLRVVELLRTDAHLREHYAKRFRHILIDEFQDTNRLQFEWLKLLDSGDNHFFAVGDDDQSIYSFRGTRPENMTDFQNELRAKTTINLELNYRSTGKILSAANNLIAHNRTRLGKTLSAVCGEGEPVALRICNNDLAEADEIANGIKQATDNGINANDIAVLYRTNAQSRQIEQKMVECGITYRIYGGTRFYDRAEVKHALAYMRLAASMDTDALLRVINFPPRGIGAKTLAQLQTTAQKSDWQSAINASENRGVRVFAALLADLRESRDALSLGEFAKVAVEKSGLIAHFDERQDGRERAENLREFVNAAAQFESSEEDALLQFLANAALESGESDSPTATGAAVSLMTVHAAKGLEFDTVFIAGLEEGLFPHSNSLGDESALEEERRLMYVAITRARKHLVLHYARSRSQYGKWECNPSSRFLDEMECFAKTPPQAERGTIEWQMAQELQGTQGYMPPPQKKIRYHKPKAPPKNPAYPAMQSTSRQESDGALRPGASVRHQSYGMGVVLSLAGEGSEREVIIAFKSAGKKTFKTKLAKLEIIQ